MIIQPASHLIYSWEHLALSNFEWFIIITPLKKDKRTLIIDAPFNILSEFNLTCLSNLSWYFHISFYLNNFKENHLLL